MRKWIFALLMLTCTAAFAQTHIFRNRVDIKNVAGTITGVTLDGAGYDILVADDLRAGDTIQAIGNLLTNANLYVEDDTAADAFIYAASRTQYLKWEQDGYWELSEDLLPKTDNTYDLGSTTLSWKDLLLDGTATVLGNLAAGDASTDIMTVRGKGNFTGSGGTGDISAIDALVIIGNNAAGSTTVPNGELILGHVSAEGAGAGEIGGQISFYSSDASANATGRQCIIRAITVSSNGSSSGLQFATGTGAAPTTGLVIYSNQNVGIGTDGSPDNKLEVNYSSAIAGTADGSGVLIEQASTGDANINFSLAGGQQYLMGIDNSATGDPFKLQTVSTNDFSGAGIEMNSSGDVSLSRKTILGPGTTLTVASNSITPTGSFHIVNTDTGQTALYTITAGVVGQMLTIAVGSVAAGSLVIHDHEAGGNIYCGGDITLNGDDTATLIYQSGVTAWLLLDTHAN